MSVPNDPPLTRREARRLQRLAEEAAAATSGQQADPGLPSAPPPGGSTGHESVSSATSAGAHSDDPIAYRTPVRPAIPRYEPATVGSAAAPGSGSAVSAPARPDSGPEAPTAPWAAAPGSFRRRDFAPSAPADDAPRSFASERPDQPLDYHTQGRSPAAPIPELVEPAEPPIVSVAAPTPAPERPLSRRELRALAAEPESSSPGGEHGGGHPSDTDDDAAAELIGEAD
ncbi:MAG: hypothetical protein ACXIUP_03965, partial [Microcella sp.]